MQTPNPKAPPIHTLIPLTKWGWTCGSEALTTNTPVTKTHIYIYIFIDDDDDERKL